jgi:hypothetical protein
MKLDNTIQGSGKGSRENFLMDQFLLLPCHHYFNDTRETLIFQTAFYWMQPQISGIYWMQPQIFIIYWMQFSGTRVSILRQFNKVF